MKNKPDRYDSEEFGYTYGLGVFELLLFPFVYLINRMLGSKNRGLSYTEDTFIGETVEVIDVVQKEDGVKYLVRVDGELWKLESGDELSKGDEVKITSSYGLHLEGEKVER